MAQFTPYFELHIRPMFRMIDRDHMLWKLDLWDYDSVKANAVDIQTNLRRPAPGFMPTEEFGGPWPQQWMQVFDDWVRAECPRLGTTKGTYALVRIGGTALELTVSIPLTNGAESAWIERLPAPPNVREYEVYLRPASPGVTKPPRQMLHVEDLVGGPVSEVIIKDTDGRRPLVLPS